MVSLIVSFTYDVVEYKCIFSPFEFAKLIVIGSLFKFVSANY